MTGGAIDVVCNVFTPQEVERGQSGIDEAFKDQLRMPPEIRGGCRSRTIWPRWIASESPVRC